MSYTNSKDETLLTYYECVRLQVEADRHSKHRFMTGAAKQYADSLSEEMDRRRLGYTPIMWP